MSILSKHMAFVNELIAIQGKLAAKFAAQDWRAAMHAENVSKLTAMLADLVETDKLLDSPSSIQLPQQLKPNRFILKPEEIEGLPPELLAELSQSSADKGELAVYNVIKEYGGIASLDQVLVGLFKKTGESAKRTTLTSRMYRMQQREMVYAVPGKKGIYSLVEMSLAEADKLFSSGPSQPDLIS